MPRPLAPSLLIAVALLGPAAPAAQAENNITPQVCTGSGGAVTPEPASPTGSSCTGGPFTGSYVHT